MALKKSQRQFAETCAKKAVFAAIIGFLGGGIFFDGLAGQAALGLMAGLAAFMYFFTEPQRKIRKDAAEIEAHLPFALMQLSLDLNIGIPPDRALKRVAESGYGLLSATLQDNMASASASGEPLRETLAKFAARSNSKAVKRAFAQVVSIYERGGKNQGEGIKKLAMELLSRKRAEIKEYGGKMGALSLMFIVLSAVVPALSISFIIAGSSFMDLPLGGREMLGLTGIAFPCLDCAILLYMNSIAPYGGN